MIVSQVKNFIKEYNLSGTFIVAFSGGFDSMCLLDVLCKAGFDVAACHLNHNWRGEESFKEAAVCEKFAKSRGIRYYSEILPDSVKKTETEAREARYDFLERCAKKFNSKVVFTAHNFEDNAETVLYRIVKGTGTAGLKGIAEKRGIFYRPLLNIKRVDIENYCKENNLNPNIDSSNSNIKYKRNLIRHKILPLMREINPKVVCAINSLSKIVKDNCKEKAAIRELLVKYNIDYDREKVENIKNFIDENRFSKSGKTLSLSKDLWLFVNVEGFEVITKKEKSYAEIEVNSIGDYEFENYIFSLREYNGENIVFGDEYRVFVSLDKINFSLRHRRNGDIIQPLGCAGIQKFKKYLNEKKIPNHKKDEIVLLGRDNEIFWAAGLGLNDKIKVVQKPTHILSLRKADYEH